MAGKTPPIPSVTSGNQAQSADFPLAVFGEATSSASAMWWHAHLTNGSWQLLGRGGWRADLVARVAVKERVVHHHGVVKRVQKIVTGTTGQSNVQVKHCVCVLH